MCTHTAPVLRKVKLGAGNEAPAAKAAATTSKTKRSTKRKALPEDHKATPTPKKQSKKLKTEVSSPPPMEDSVEVNEDVLTTNDHSFGGGLPGMEDFEFELAFEAV